MQREARAEDRSFSSVLLPDCRACRTDRASVRNTTLGEERVLFSMWAAAAFRASASAL